jgi:hypothetical protein
VPLVPGEEVVAERAVQVVAVAARGVARGELRLGDPAEVADDRERDVGERDLDELALPRPGPVAVRRQEPDGRQGRSPTGTRSRG